MKLQHSPTPRVAEAILAVAAGETRAAVAARLGMSENAVAQALDRWRYWKPPAVAPVVQHRCLQCRREFEAEHRGNWVCATCKSAERWRA